jgi:hypothetical protein
MAIFPCTCYYSLVPSGRNVVEPVVAQARQKIVIQTMSWRCWKT